MLPNKCFPAKSGTTGAGEGQGTPRAKRTQLFKTRRTGKPLTAREVKNSN